VSVNNFRNRGIRESTNTVMKPQRKNSMVNKINEER